VLAFRYRIVTQSGFADIEDQRSGEMTGRERRCYAVLLEILAVHAESCDQLLAADLEGECSRPLATRERRHFPMVARSRADQRQEPSRQSILPRDSQYN
jgi:hypothetical protein